MNNLDYDTITADVGLTISITPIKWRFYIDGWRDNPCAFFRAHIGPLYIALER